MKIFSKIAVLILVFNQVLVFACDACKIQQPKITQNFTHGTGPTSQLDWLIVGLIAAITLGTLFFSLKYLFKPGEKNKNHIKNSVLEF